MTKASKPVKLAFELNCIEMPLGQLHPDRVLAPTIKDGDSYKRVRASVAAIGIVEPLVVIPHPAHQGAYKVIDGVLRLMVMQDLGVTEALCLISTDDEAYTYNKHVNRLSVIQEHRMIVRAYERGASVQLLADALDVSEAAIRARFRLLDGICDEAVRLLAEKPAGLTVFALLRKMSAFRQIDVARTMIGFDNYSVKLVESMLDATPQEQLAPGTKVKVRRSGGLDVVQRLQQELSAVQADTKVLEETYADATLQLAIIKSHVKTMLESARIVRWLAKFHHEYLQQLQLIAEIKQLPAT